VLFTSGTTGVPKAALLRQRHLVSYVLGSVEFGAAGEDEAALVSVPPYHVAGVAAMLSSLYAGRRIVQLPAFAPEVWLDLAERERVSHAFVVPTMLARIVAALEARGAQGPASLRSLAYGGGRMPLPVIERAMALLPGTAFTNAYGLTETSSTIALLGPEEHRVAAASEDPAVRRRLASVGRALPGVEIEIRDEEGRPVAPGRRGEIHVRGEQVAGEYLGRGSVLTTDGWFPTRDGGVLDEEGYLFVEGRIDDVIVRGGENLSPGEIEDVLHEHPAVADCAVVGVPDEQWGEAVAAAVVLRPGVTADAQAMREHVRRHLRSSRVPARIDFVPDLPYNETGKLLRRVVRERLGGDASGGA
jgi:acyl-CoA synthetase (AMP-forming)/AMP-acid ligase II